MKKYIILLIIFGFLACGDEEPGSGTMNSIIPEISIDDNFISERDVVFNSKSTVSISEATDQEVSVDYITVSKTASAGNDFEMIGGTVIISPGQLSAEIEVPIIPDGEKELHEYFEISLSNPKNGTIKDGRAVISLKDIDKAISNVGDGYTTDIEQDGYDLVWSDEFDGNVLNEATWTYELGNGCDVGLCGWGNSELQSYSADENNIFVDNGILTITALQETESSYSSARIITKDKEEFRFGRIDIRAKLPTGQGIWPAIWMLGANIDEKSWPACGEIDIMEHRGHLSQTSTGAAHWGNEGDPSTFRSSSFNINESFELRYHVFSLLWTTNSVKWYVDETEFFEITTSDVNNTEYPFNRDFFFILNIAVGGNYPGNPDETTIFPQTMEVDYVRVFQEKQ